jgi:uncharacterized membrane protein
MNDIDEFLKVALALFLSISGLLLLLTYLERSLSEPAKESARQVTSRLGARGAVYQWLLRRRRKSKRWCPLTYSLPIESSQPGLFTILNSHCAIV